MNNINKEIYIDNKEKLAAEAYTNLYKLNEAQSNISSRQIRTNYKSFTRFKSKEIKYFTHGFILDPNVKLTKAIMAIVSVCSIYFWSIFFPGKTLTISNFFIILGFKIFNSVFTNLFGIFGITQFYTIIKILSLYSSYTVFPLNFKNNITFFFSHFVEYNFFTFIINIMEFSNISSLLEYKCKVLEKNNNKYKYIYIKIFFCVLSFLSIINLFLYLYIFKSQPPMGMSYINACLTYIYIFLFPQEHILSLKEDLNSEKKQNETGKMQILKKLKSNNFQIYEVKEIFTRYFISDSIGILIFILRPYTMPFFSMFTDLQTYTHSNFINIYRFFSIFIAFMISILFFKNNIIENYKKEKYQLSIGDFKIMSILIFILSSLFALATFSYQVSIFTSFAGKYFYINSLENVKTGSFITYIIEIIRYFFNILSFIGKFKINLQ